MTDQEAKMIISTMDSLKDMVVANHKLIEFLEVKMNLKLKELEEKLKEVETK